MLVNSDAFVDSQPLRTLFAEQRERNFDGTIQIRLISQEGRDDIQTQFNGASQNIHTECVVFFNRTDISIEAYSMPPLEKRIGLFSLTNLSKYSRYSLNGIHIVEALLALSLLYQHKISTNS